MADDPARAALELERLLATRRLLDRLFTEGLVFLRHHVDDPERQTVTGYMGDAFELSPAELELVDRFRSVPNARAGNPPGEVDPL